MRWHQDHWAGLRADIRAAGGEVVTVSSQTRTYRHPELAFGDGLRRRWGLPPDWRTHSDPDNELAARHGLFLDEPLSTMNPGAEATYRGGRAGRMAQPGCVVVAGRAATPPGRVLYSWALRPARANLRGAVSRVAAGDVAANAARWAARARGGDAATPFGDVRIDAQARPLDHSMRERFPERVQRLIMAAGKAPKGWKVIPDAARLDEDGNPMGSRKLDPRGAGPGTLPPQPRAAKL